jgi:hypothetical protein
LQSAALSFEISLDHAGRYLPLAQDAQAESDEPEYLPPGQVEHAESDEPEYLPLGQVEHDAAEETENLPSGQGEHAVFGPAVAFNLPAGHAPHEPAVVAMN